MESVKAFDDSDFSDIHFMNLCILMISAAYPAIIYSVYVHMPVVLLSFVIADSAKILERAAHVSLLAFAVVLQLYVIWIFNASMIVQSVRVDVTGKDCYDIPDKKLQGRVKFPIGGKPRKP